MSSLRLAAPGRGALPARTGDMPAEDDGGGRRAADGVDKPQRTSRAWARPPARTVGGGGGAAGSAPADATSQGTTSQGTTAAPGVPDTTEIVAILDRARNGDAEAFGLLYDRYVHLVYRYVYFRVGAHALAEDLTSETFLRALRRIGSFTWQGKDFGAWLVTIARNLVADHYKSGRFRLEVSTADMLDAERAEDGPESSAVQSAARRALFEAVRRLGPEQQECVVLRFLQELSVSETALVMGKNEGAVKALQYRAMRSLARLLPPDLR